MKGAGHVLLTQTRWVDPIVRHCLRVETHVEMHEEAAVGGVVAQSTHTPLELLVRRAAACNRYRKEDGDFRRTQLLQRPRDVEQFIDRLEHKLCSCLVVRHSTYIIGA